MDTKNFREVFDDGFKDAVRKIIGLSSPAHCFHNSYLLGQVQELANLEPLVIQLKEAIAEQQARIEQLEKQRDELLAAAKIILSDAPLDNGVMALAAAVRNAKQKPMTNALEKDLDAATDEATRGEI